MKSATRRPSVKLTVARMMNTRNKLTPLQQVYLNRIMVHHGQPNRDHLVKACLDCGTITEAPDQDTRDHVVDNFYVACCGEPMTIIFRTERV